MGPFRHSDIGSTLRLQDDADDNNNYDVPDDDDNTMSTNNFLEESERAHEAEIKRAERFRAERRDLEHTPSVE